MSKPIDDTETERTPEVLIDVAETDDREFTEAMLTAIADHLDTDPTSLPPIGESIDPDILSDLQSEDEPVKTLTFEYAGHEIVVTSDGIVQMRPLS